MKIVKVSKIWHIDYLSTILDAEKDGLQAIEEEISSFFPIEPLTIENRVWVIFEFSTLRRVLLIKAEDVQATIDHILQIYDEARLIDVR